MDSSDKYCIKKDYISRTSYTHYDDRGATDSWQDEVYFAAHQIANTNQFSTIADVGCGSGYKLIKYFSSYQTVGFEIEPTLSFLKATYPDRLWESSDFSQPLIGRKFDLIICSDVIEHLVDPNELLNWLQGLDFKLLVISTPDRDRLLSRQRNYQSQTGPPVNSAHVREWSFDELKCYIGRYFDIVDHFHTEKEYWGQTIVVKKRSS